MAHLDRLERISLEIYGGCNYSCKMCPQSWGRGSQWTRKMPLSLFESILDQVTDEFGKPVVNLQGSGEPSLVKDLSKYVEACTRRQLPSYIYTNGSHLNGDRMRDAIDAGLSYVRFSCIGYDRKSYREWMSKDNFDLVRQNARELKQYVEETASSCRVSSYHLVTDPANTKQEIDLYRKNFVDWLGITGYIYKMHNWSGNLESQPRRRPGEKRRTCGRPFAPELTVRAGGTAGHQAAVTPCCMTLGPPNETKSVLGHLDSQTIQEVWQGEKYQELRQKHREEDFDSIDYCKNCDFLVEDPEVLVWTNDKDWERDRVIGTEVDFKKYQPSS